MLGGNLAGASTIKVVAAVLGIVTLSVGGAWTAGIIGAPAVAGVENRFGGTFLVNVVGSFALGVVLAAPVADAAVLAFGTGFCGAFTTFSTFAFETVRLFETGRRRAALGNAAGTLLAALVAVAVGSVVGGALG